MDMNMEDRRATPRFLVQFHTTVSGPTQPEGTGLIPAHSGLFQPKFAFPLTLGSRWPQ